jgi:allophanate hydrolase
MRANGLPFGVTLIAPAFHEGVLASLGAAFHAATGLNLGATGHPVPAASSASTGELPGPEPRRSARLAVAGLHLSGQPLNGQLLELGARLAETVRTAPCYRMHVIERPGRKFPGLVRAAEGGAVELEVWEMSPAALGAFMEKVAEPLCIGTIELESGEKVKGFLCEGWAAAGARDITALGGWRAYLATG